MLFPSGWYFKVVVVGDECFCAVTLSCITYRGQHRSEDTRRSRDVMLYSSRASSDTRAMSVVYGIPAEAHRFRSAITDRKYIKMLSAIFPSKALRVCPEAFVVITQ